MKTMLGLAGLAAAALAAPEQIHLAHRDAHSVWVSWLDDAPTTTDAPGTVLVNGNTFTAAPSKYDFHGVGGNPYTSPYIYHAAATGLECGTTYDYVVSSGGASDSNTFNTIACAAGADKGVVVGIVGDLGQTNDSKRTIDMMVASRKDVSIPTIDQVWLLGDLSYADAAWAGPPAYCYNQSTGCKPERWDSFGRLAEPLTEQLVIHALPGNHESEDDPLPIVGEPYVAFTSRYKAPLSAPRGAPYYYSWNTGNAHFISLNSYEAFDHDSAQYKWLEQDLASVNRSQTPWIFAATHAPWYNSNKNHQNEKEEFGMKASMEPLMHRYEVDALVCGHVHAYERSYPVYNGVVTEGAMMEFNIGDGGNREHLEPDSWLPDRPEWSAFRRYAFGHGVMQTFNATHAQWSWHVTEESRVLDSVLLVKNAHLGGGKPKRGVTSFQL